MSSAEERRSAELMVDERAVGTWRTTRFTPPGVRPDTALELADVAPQTKVWAALRRAAIAAGEAVRRPGGELADAADAVPAQLASICEAVRLAAGGRLPRVDSLDTAEVPTLLAALRYALIEELRRVGDALPREQGFAVLLALEDVRIALERDRTRRFMDRLAAPDATELVVEVAHDMRSPLTSILFLVETLRSGHSGEVNHVQERQLGLVYSAALALSSITGDVVDLAQGGERLMDRQPIAFSLTEILQNVLAMLRPVAEEKQLALRLTPPEAAVRVGHPSALSRILLNLTTNALKFTDSGFVEVNCRALSRTEVEFSVRDTGRGIPPEVLSTLFHPFRRRACLPGYYFSSAGLGLSICEKLVKKLGGELQVETAPGVGTRFFFVLDLPSASRLSGPNLAS